jgi:endoglucanase
MLELTQELCALSGVSGWEDDVRDRIRELIAPYADEIETDPLGNLYVFKHGRVHNDRTIMICAHMDEVGLIVTGIDENGYLRVDQVGGIDRRVLFGKRVFAGPDAIPGVVGCVPKHLLSEEEMKTKVPAWENIYVDIGAHDRAEAESRIRAGDRITFDPVIRRMGDSCLMAKAIDDRVGCAAMIQLLRSELPCDVRFVFTVQEEVGCRGARAAAARVRPEIGIVLEGTTAADVADVPEGREICSLGKGVVIPFMDRSTIYPRRLWELAVETAKKSGVAWQTKNRIAGGTDASAVQRTAGGAEVITMSVPVRNIHSPSGVADIRDIECLPKLCACLLEELAHGS